MNLEISRLQLPLSDFPLEVDARLGARITGVFGASGAGKTSLLEVIAGLRQPARGRIVLDDAVLSDAAAGAFLAPERSHIGYVPQDDALFPHLNVRENLRYSHLADRDGHRPEITYEHVVAVLDIDHLAERRVGSLSGGERQRVTFGRAVLASPRLLLLDAPLAVILQSSSAAGKSSLMEAVLALMPEEQRVQYSAMTGQSLFYMTETELKNKILAIVEEEGAQRAAYALKLLQSEGVLTIASTGKDPATGKLVTHEYRVEGPVMIFLTTTAIEIDEELLNRCLVLTVDEDREQTRAIHRIQREAQTLEGLLAKRRRGAVVALHRNAQRLLKPISVVNPHADRLTFPDGLTRTRRDHMKFLSLIRAVTLLFQYQRPVKTVQCDGQTLEYIESTREDVKLAEDLIKQVLGRSLDELPPQTRRLLLLVDDLVKEQCEQLAIERKDYRFSRRDVRQYTGWSDAQVKRHLHKLEELEYLIVHHGGRGQTIVYELFFDRPADPRQPFLPGLWSYDWNKDGREDEKDPSNAPQVRAMYGPGTGAPEPITTGLGNGFCAFSRKLTDTGERVPSAIVAAGRS